MPKRKVAILTLVGVATALVFGIVFYLSSNAYQWTGQSMSLAANANSIDALGAKPAFVSEIKGAGQSDVGTLQVQIVRPTDISPNKQTEIELQFTRSNGHVFLEDVGYKFAVMQRNNVVYESTGISVDGTETVTPTFQNGAARIYVILYPGGELPPSNISDSQTISELEASSNSASFDIANIG